MSIFDFFFGRKQNENNSRRGVKLNRHAVRTRNLAMEPLETRDLLSVTTGLIDDSSYAELRAQYPDFNLPEEQSDLNVMTVDCNLTDLKKAISQACSSSTPDLILVKTTNSSNTITYTSSSDLININGGGSITVIGWGTNALTINANQKCRVMSISGSTNAYLGNLIITKGKVNQQNGGGIYSTSTGDLVLSNSTISNNSASSSETLYGGGIYSSANNNLILTNCTIINNSVSTTSSDTYSRSSYGGGICSTSNGALALINCNISNNNAISYSSNRTSQYGGGIYIASNKSLTLTNCIISNNSISSGATSYGSGIYNNSSGNITLTNCIVSKNSTSSNNVYGVICSGYHRYANIKIINSTIADNSNYAIFNYNAVFNIYNSIIVNNSNNLYNSEGTINAYNTLSSFSDWTNKDSATNYKYNSSQNLFGNSYVLSDHSQATNRGNNSYAVDSSGQPLTTDLAGNPRIIDSIVDLGAYEYDSRPILSNPVYSVIVKGTLTKINIFPVANATAYRIEYSLNSDFSNSMILDVQAGENSLENLLELQTYYFRIKSIGDINYKDSNYSTSESFYTSIPLTGLTLSPEFPIVDSSISATVFPSNSTVKYQWFVGDTLLDSVTTPNFTVTADYIGQTITCVATGTDDYIGTISATTPIVLGYPLDAPEISPLTTYNNTVVVADWSAIDHADGYTFEYQLDGSDNWITTTGLLGTTEAFVGNIGSTYNVRVKANGTGDYSDSDFSDIVSITLAVPPTPLTSLALSSIAPEVGTEIIASLIPTDATADYQWFSGETLIEGATGSTFIVTEDQIGQTITCVATGIGDYTGTVSMTTAVVPVPVTALDAPADVALSVYNATVTALWSAVENASSYTLEYKPVDAENWTALPGLEDTTASFVGVSGTMYNVRVKAVGTGDYSDSPYAEINTDKPTGPVVAINANKVTVSWVDDSPAADSVRYRVAGTTRWTVKKLNAGITEMSFNATIGSNYDIEVLLDQQENNVLQGSAIVLDQPRLTSIRNELKDDTFQVNVTNYAAKNLAANVKQAIVSVNGVMTTLKIADQQGETALANGGKVAFSNGLFTFSEMNSNTSYKVMISFSDGHSVSKTSSALTVKTLKAPYLPSVIVSANAVSDTAITVTWETAHGKNSTTPAQKYTVQYSTDGNKWTNATTGATGNSYTIQRLKGGVEYQVRVLATKDAAFEASAPSGVLSAQTLTLPKTVLDRTSVKDDTFKLNVTNYATSNLVNAPTLNVKSDKFGEAAIAIQNGSGSATFENGMVAAFENGALTFTNVPSNTQQKIQVNFSNGVCTTAWTAALTVKTTIAPYNKPVLTNATATSSTSVLVEWDAVTGKNSTVLAPSYTVQYTIDGTRWTSANTRVVGTSFTIPNLKPNTSYRVAVIANKDAKFNASLPSESWEVRTL